MVGRRAHRRYASGVERQGHQNDDHLRVSDREREQVVELLGQATAEGRLTLDEYTERVGAAHAAVTRGELARLTTDLPVGQTAPAAPTGYVGESERIVAIFSTESRKGVWAVPPHLRVQAIFGDCKLELHQTPLPHRVTRIDATVVFGDVTVYVPEGIDVRITGTAIFGSKESKLRTPPSPGAPVIEIRCHVTFGSVTVRPPRKKWRWG